MTTEELSVMSDVMESLTAMIEYAEATKRFADAGSLKRVATEIETLRTKVAELEAGSEQQAKAAKITRPECFEFAMDYLGDPEASLVRAYIEDLEAAVEQPVKVPEGYALVPLEPTDSMVDAFYNYFHVAYPGEEMDNIIASAWFPGAYKSMLSAQNN